MKLKWILVLLLSLFIARAGAIELDINSSNALVYNLNEDKIMYNKNIDSKTYIASLTKLMTALVVVDNVDDLDNIVTVNKNDLLGLRDAYIVGLKVNDKLSYKDLLYLLLLPSAGDAANVLGNNVGLSINGFVSLMNEKAKELGMNNTMFSNPIGLDDDNNYSTLRDYLLLFKKVYNNNLIKDIMSTYQYTTSNGKYTVYNSSMKNMRANGIIIDNYMGGKTGYTSLAGKALASFSYDGNVTYFVITTNALNDKELYTDTKYIYDYMYSNYGYNNIIDGGINIDIPVKDSNIKNYRYTFDKDVYLYTNNNYNKKDISYEYDIINNVNYKTKKGSSIGTLYIKYKGEIVHKSSIILNENIYMNIYRVIKYVLMFIFSILVLVLASFINKFNNVRRSISESKSISKWFKRKFNVCRI